MTPKTNTANTTRQLYLELAGLHLAMAETYEALAHVGMEHLSNGVIDAIDATTAIVAQVDEERAAKRKKQKVREPRPTWAQIRDLIIEHGPMSPLQLSEHFTCSLASVKNTLTQLLDEGKLVRERTGKDVNGRTTTYLYAIPKPEPRVRNRDTVPEVIELPYAGPARGAPIEGTGRKGPLNGLQKDFRELLEEAGDQIEYTRSGGAHPKFVVKATNETFNVPTSSSDRRALENLRAEMRQKGVVWS